MKSTDDAQDMNIFETRLVTRTSSVPDFVDLTEEITDAISRAGIKDGRVTVFAPDDSCSLMVNERESGLLADLRNAIERLGPSNGDQPGSIIGSSSVVLPVEGGKPRLGIWQRVQLVELTEARERTIEIHVVGER